MLDNSWQEWEAKKRAAVEVAIARQQAHRQMRQAVAAAAVPKVLRLEDPLAAWAAHPLAPAWRYDHLPWSQTAELIQNSDLVRSAVERALHHIDSEAKRSRALLIAAAITPLDEKAGHKMNVCNDPEQLEMGICVHSDEAGAPALAMIKVRRQRCWLRVCPKCQRDIAARLRVRYEKRIRTILAAPVRGWTLKSFVLTTDRQIGDDGAELKDGAAMKWLGDNVKKLVKHFWGMKGAGAFATFEVGPVGGKLHAHGISYGRYVRQTELSDYWRQLTGCQVVYIRQVTPSEAVREGIKYIAKLSKRDEVGNFELPVEQLAELHMGLKGRRRLRAWGCFYGMADEGDELATDEGDELEQAERCDGGHRMIFVSVAVVRAELLQFKGAIKCPVPGGALAESGAGFHPLGP